jgi:NitT/TauT family transport system substrate-binding protein
MGDRVIALPAQSGQPVFGVLVARDELIAHNPSLISRFLKSLDMAAEYTISHPAESRAVVQRHTNLSDEYMAVMWPANRFSLSLDQSLISAMEDEARWMIANNLTNATAVPDFGRYMYIKGLDEIKPGSVRIFG